MKNKIYDCFTFYNELDLLEIRLRELYTLVDEFVIVESNQTFTGNKKPWNFEANVDRYSNYMDKITYVRVKDMPNTGNPWDNEIHQRNAILRGIKDAKKDDLIMISDVDEIVRPRAVEYMRDSDQTLFALRMPIYNFKFNYMKLNPDRYNIWAMAARKSTFSDITPNSLRDLRFSFFQTPYQFKNDGCEVIEHGGWHFGYLGDNDMLKNKAQNFSHQEVNRPDFLEQIDVETSIRNRKSWDQSSQDQYVIVKLDNYFPKSLVDYPEFVLEEFEHTAFDLLPEFPYN